MKKKKNRVWLGRAVLLVTFWMGGIAQAGSPEETVKAYMTALTERGLHDTTAFFHPAELARFKEMLMPVFRAASENESEVAMVSIFGTGTTLAQLEKWTPLEFMSRFMKAVGEQIQGVKFEAIEVLGSVPEGERVHVVTRIGLSTENGIRMTKMEIVTTLRDGNDWKLALTGQMEGLAGALKGK